MVQEAIADLVAGRDLSADLASGVMESDHDGRGHARPVRRIRDCPAHQGRDRR